MTSSPFDHWRNTCGSKLNSNGGNIRITVTVIHLEGKAICPGRIHISSKGIFARSGIE